MIRHSTKARINSPSTAASSLTPRRSTLWLSIGNAGIDEARAGRARRGGELARVVGMEHHVGRLARRLERAHERRRHARGLDHRHAGVHADDLDVLDRRQRLDDLPETPRREHERIAAGEDHLPDLAMVADIAQRGVELLARERRAPRPTTSRRKQKRQ